MRILSVAALFLLHSVSGHTQPPVRGGLPCLLRVCVGAPLSSVMSLRWEPVTLGRAGVDQDAVDRLRMFVRAPDETLQGLVPYWTYGAFDTEGLALLHRLEAVCQELGVWMRPRASYVDDEGRRVTATFDVVPDGQGQRFEIATLSLVHARDLPDEELARIGREEAKRYAGVPPYPNEVHPGVQWLPRAAEGPTLRLFAPLADNRDLARHPACRAD